MDIYTWDVSNGYYSIDISRLHETFQFELPRITAREFYDSRTRENGQENSHQQEMEQQVKNDHLTDIPQQSVRSGVTLIPNGAVGKEDAVTKL